jgi:glycosyltransferase involved in cell wall biosynthesis
MKVLHIISSLSVGGAERALYNLLRGGLSDELDCTVLSLRDEGAYGARIRALGVPVHTLELQTYSGLVAAGYKIRNLVSKFQPDVIQGWMYHGNLAASLARLLSIHKPVVVWNIRHSLYDILNEKTLTRYVIRGNKQLSKKIETIIYNSQLAKEQHEAFGFSIHSGIVIPNGFDLNELSERNDIRNKLRSAFGIDERDIVIGHVARLHPMKDHQTFLHSAVKVIKSYERVKFMLIGRNVQMSTPELAGIVPPESEKHFIFLGERSDVYDIMQAMDILCVSSAWGEGFPNVLGEAMASSVPCVTTDVGDSRHIVGDTGLVVSPSDTSALTDALNNMVALSYDERRALGRKARKRIAENYSLKSVCKSYEKVYRDCVHHSFP